MKLYFAEITEPKYKSPFLRKALNDYLEKSIDDVEGSIFYGVQGKPYLKSGEAMFSVSHTGEFWFCIICNVNVGLDFEKVKKRDYNKLAGRFFSENEEKLVTEEGESTFYKIWTRKEAMAKHTGEGISFAKLMDFETVQSGKDRRTLIENFPNGVMTDLDFVIQDLKRMGKITKEIDIYGSVFVEKKSKSMDLKRELEIICLSKDDL